MKKLIFYMLILLLSVTAISCGKYDFWDTFTSDNKIPASISFIDVNPDEDYLTGDVIVGKAADEANVTSYKLYWGSSASTKSSSTPIATLPADGTNKTFSLNHLAVPSGATHLIAVTANSSGDMTKSIAVDFEDLVVRLEKDVRTTPTIASSSDPLWLTEMGGKIYFFASTAGGVDFRSYDPATGLLSPVISSHTYEAFDELKVFSFSYKGWVYYKARVNPSTSLLLDQFAIHRYNGSTLEMVNAYENGSLFLNTANDILYFFGTDKFVYDLYSFNTISGVLANLTSSGGTLNVLANTKIIYRSSDSMIYYIVNNGGIKLFSHDGVTQSIVASLNNSNGGLILHNNLLIYDANNLPVTDGVEPWKYDFDNPGQSMLGDLYPGANNSSNPGYFFSWNNYIYFLANDSFGNELYRTDGVSPPVQVYDINSTTNTGAFSGIPSIKYFNNKLYMRANDAVFVDPNFELWETDGIPGGVTRMVKDFYPAGNGDVRIGSAFNNKLFMRATDDGTNFYLWFYDPDKMTVPLKIETIAGIDPINDVVVGNRLYFSATDPAHGRELWVLYYK